MAIMYSTFLYNISIYRLEYGLTFTSEQQPSQAAPRRAVAGAWRTMLSRQDVGVQPKQVTGTVLSLDLAQALVVYTVEEKRKSGDDRLSLNRCYYWNVSLNF